MKLPFITIITGKLHSSAFLLAITFLELHPLPHIQFPIKTPNYNETLLHQPKTDTILISSYDNINLLNMIIQTFTELLGHSQIIIHRLVEPRRVGNFGNSKRIYVNLRDRESFQLEVTFLQFLSCFFGIYQHELFLCLDLFLMVGNHMIICCLLTCLLYLLFLHLGFRSFLFTVRVFGFVSKTFRFFLVQFLALLHIFIQTTTSF